MANQRKNTKAVNCLLKELEDAIMSGNRQQAAVYAKKLATLKVKCLVKRNLPKNDDLLNVDLYIEDRLTRQGPIPLQLPTLMTVADLKERISHVYDIPTNVQRWTINDKVADDNDANLVDLQAAEGSAMFLHLVAPNLQMFSKAKRPRIEPVPYNLDDLFNNSNNSDEEEGNNDHEPHKIIIENPGNNHDNIEVKLIEKFNEDADVMIEEIPLVGNLGAAVEINHEAEILEEITVKKPTVAIRDVINDEIEPGIVEKRTGVTEIEVINEIVPENPIELVEEQEPVEYHELMMLANCEVVPNTDYFNCPICLVDFGPYEGIQLHECLHAFCRDCLVNTIKHSEEPQVKCPYVDDIYACESIILEREIRALVDPDIYEAHLSKSVKQAESSAGENAFHCKTPDCNGWCFYDAERYHFSCPKCDKTNCLRCKVIHEGKSCTEYQEDVLIANDPNHATNLTQVALNNLLQKGEAMKCPSCNMVITKESGCDAVQCGVCKTEICWATRGPRWGPNGIGDTSGGCKCKVNGRRCHPLCQNCH